MNESLQRIYKKIEENNASYDMLIDRGDKLSTRIRKLEKFAEDTPEYLHILNAEFENLTQLNEIDIQVMFMIIGLQILRQHVLTKFPQRLSDKESAKNTFGHFEEHSDRKHRYYNPSLEEIITNPVPFDANIGAKGALSGGGSLGHRITALGHDPLIGLVIGTANIATSTLTTNRWESYHIMTYNKRDVFTERAKTSLVMEKTVKKLLDTDLKEKAKVGCAFIKELIHLQSDLHTKKSLPIPVLSVLSPEEAIEMAEYGFDFSNIITVSKQFVYARLINSIMAMLHYSFYDKKISIDLYKVKTKKIICYSNLVASSTNIVEVYITRDSSLLDIGGISNTIFEIVTSTKFIKKVKRDFIFGEYDKALANL